MGLLHISLPSYFHTHLGEQWGLLLIALCVAFFIAAFVDSIAGGGGFISTPSLLLAGIPPHLALGTNKLIVVFGTCIASMNFIAHKKVLWRIVIIGVIFSTFGAFLGSKAVMLTQESALKTIILCLLPIAAILALLPRTFHQGKHSFSHVETFVLAPLISLSIGFYDGYFGPGTGSFLIVAFYVVLRMDLLYASGCSKLINLGSGIGSLIAFILAGQTLYLLAIPLILCNMLGGYLGSKLALQKGAKIVRYMVIVVFILMFGSLIIQYV